MNENAGNQTMQPSGEVGRFEVVDLSRRPGDPNRSSAKLNVARMKRLRFHLTIRAMLALTAVVGILCALEVRRWHNRKAIAEAIRQSNGLAFNDVVGPKWVRKLVDDDDAFTKVKSIEFGPGFTGFDLDNPIGDARLRAALSPIPPGTRLDYLGLDRSSISDRSLELIADFHVGSLNLDNTAVTDTGVRHLGRVTTLTKLRLGNTAVTDEGLRLIAELQNLEELILRNTSVTDAGLVALVKLPRLQLLDLDETSVSDEGLAVLGKIKSLSTVVIRKTDVTASGVQQLRDSLPACRIGANY